MNLFLTRSRNVPASSKQPYFYMCNMLEILEPQKELQPTDPARRNGADLGGSQEALLPESRRPSFRGAGSPGSPSRSTNAGGARD